MSTLFGLNTAILIEFQAFLEAELPSEHLQTLQTIRYPQITITEKDVVLSGFVKGSSSISIVYRPKEKKLSVLGLQGLNMQTFPKEIK